MLTRRTFIARASAALAGVVAAVAGVPWGGSERWSEPPDEFALLLRHFFSGYEATGDGPYVHTFRVDSDVNVFRVDNHASQE